MRVRDEAASTGRLLAWFDPDNRRTNTSLLLLVTGARDIATATRVEEAANTGIHMLGLDHSFEWHVVADQADLASIDPHLDPSRVTRVEVSEFVGIEGEELEELLGDALGRMARLERALFPSAGGAVGSTAQGINLLGREQELQQLEGHLSAGEHVLLLAPRRSGKTTVLMELQRRRPRSTLYLELERSYSPEQVAGQARARVDGQSVVHAIGEARARGWATVLEESLRALAGRDGDGRALLLLDELHALLRSLRAPDKRSTAGDVAAFVDALSTACLRAGARVVVAGSVDLRQYVQDSWGLEALPGLFGDLRSFRLPPLDSSPIELRRLLIGTGLVPEAGDVEWLRDNVDLALPYPALLFLDSIAAETRSRRTMTAQDLEAALERFVFGTNAFADIEERVYERCNDWPGLESGTAALLDRLRDAGPRGVDRDDAAAMLPRAGSPQVLTWFEETFPVRADGGNLVLVSALFARWWERRGWHR